MAGSFFVLASSYFTRAAGRRGRSVAGITQNSELTRKNGWAGLALPAKETGIVQVEPLHWP